MTSPAGFGARDALDLLDWKRRIAALYADVRAADDPARAWERWRDARERLYREHPQSPVPAASRAAYGDAFFAYDPAFRVVAEIVAAERGRSDLPVSTGGTFAFTRVGTARFRLGGETRELDLRWNEGYGGGVLVVVADATSGAETYAGGRYVLDTVKGADLGGTDGTLVLDFNFAFNPSCAFDPSWACPLAPPGSRLPLALRVGERAP